jgi:hypothetical protein
MQLRSGGLDVIYIDESHDNRFYVITAVAIPFIRPNYGDGFNLAWSDHFDGAKRWRRRVKDAHTIPTTKELHAAKLASGRGNFKLGKHNFDKAKATAIYRRILEDVDFIPDASVLSAAAKRGHRLLYGNNRLEAALYAVLQRLRRQCNDRDVNGMVFFDQGHAEYRKLYRQAQVFLPTGSRLGAWEPGKTSRNLPLDMFVKDGNEKDSKHCWFTQLADLIAYAAFMKVKAENGALEDWQERYSLGNLYESVPSRIINKAASGAAPRDGIVRLS